MEAEAKGKGQEGARSSVDNTIDAVKAIAAFNARADLNDPEQLLLFLRSWWSRTYNRPLKDPLLLSYTPEELIYEFFDRIERIKAQEEQVNKANDKIEEDKEKAALDWAEQEEKRELEAEMRKGAKDPKMTEDPTKDPANVAWMEEQLQKAKAVFGESFGEDINEDFSE